MIAYIIEHQKSKFTNNYICEFDQFGSTAVYMFIL